jgi:hypothetical protein
MNATQPISLYIPVLPSDMSINGKSLFDESSLMDYFDKNLNIGIVKRVDYVSKILENKKTRVSAFIHFERFYDSAAMLLQKITNGEDIRFDSFINEFDNRVCKITSTSNSRMNRFFVAKMNKTPIPEITVPEPNVSQLIANNKFMEKLIEEQKLKIAEMEEEIKLLKNNSALLYSPLDKGEDSFMEKMKKNDFDTRAKAVAWDPRMPYQNYGPIN